MVTDFLMDAGNGGMQVLPSIIGGLGVLGLAKLARRLIWGRRIGVGEIVIGRSLPKAAARMFLGAATPILAGFKLLSSGNRVLGYFALAIALVDLAFEISGFRLSWKTSANYERGIEINGDIYLFSRADHVSIANGRLNYQKGNRHLSIRLNDEQVACYRRNSHIKIL